MDIQQEKAKLREQMKTRKQSLTETERSFRSGKIFEKILCHEAYRKAQTVLLYASLPDEPDTFPLLNGWTFKKVLLPVVEGDFLTLKVFTGIHFLQKGSLKVEEPQGEPFTDYEAIGLVLVPGVAFSPEGRRLGRGKGYYDKLLPQLKNAVKIGVCFDFQLVSEIPSDPWDYRLDGIISG
jgi:5-formyltetrahydrofolate cyclo-ligase